MNGVQVSLLALMAVGAHGVTRQDATYHAERLSSGPPAIDGVLDESLWTSALWDRRFTTSDGATPTQATLFAIFYDSVYVYLGLAMNDESPGDITRTPGARDDTNGDRIATFFDTNLDRETSYVFVVNAAGVVRDQWGTGNGQSWDSGWDAEWQSGVATDEFGWSVELRIPLAELSVETVQGQRWGLQFTRVVERLQEVTHWRPVDGTRGWTGSFGTLVFRD